MKALVQSPEGALLEEREKPVVCASDEVRIRVRRAALCRTDLYVATGILQCQPGVILGHEFAGVIDHAGRDVKRVSVGDRVVVNPSLACDACRDSGTPHRCSEPLFLGIDRNGAFAEWIVVREHTVESLPDDLSYELGAYVEPVAAVMAVLEAGIGSSDRVLVVGQGRIAELSARVMIDHGFKQVVVAPTSDEDNAFDVVVEAGVKEDEWPTLIRVLKPDGLLIVKSRRPGSLAIPTLPFIRKRITLRGVYYGEFRAALAYVRTNRDWFTRHLGRRYRLEEFEQAFAAESASETDKLFFAVSEDQPCVG